jgi:hypothetical protein
MQGHRPAAQASRDTEPPGGGITRGFKKQMLAADFARDIRHLTEAARAQSRWSVDDVPMPAGADAHNAVVVAKDEFDGDIPAAAAVVQLALRAVERRYVP